jgi:hypothetical protein
MLRRSLIILSRRKRFPKSRTVDGDENIPWENFGERHTNPKSPVLHATHYEPGKRGGETVNKLL